MRPRFMFTGCLTLFIGALSACGGKANFATENDALRAQVMDLQTQVDSLQRRNAELEVELRQASTVSDSSPEEIRAATPHVVSIDLSRLSHARDEDGDGEIDTLLLYINPADGMGRFVQIVGHLSVTAAILPADADAITIGRAGLDPAELRAAYRSGLTGVYYAVRVPIALPSGRDEASAVVRAVFVDGATGRSLDAQREVSLLKVARP
jgi:hypothetical protein